MGSNVPGYTIVFIAIFHFRIFFEAAYYLI
jgi:hypothetical protein